MAFDDEGDDGPEFSDPLPPDDRLWRHPAEIRSPDSTPTPPPALAAGLADERVPGDATRQDGSSARLGTPWATSILSGLIGAVFSLGLVAAAGGLGVGIVDQPTREAPLQVPVPASSSAAPASADVSTIVEIAERVRPSILRIEVTTDAGTSTGSGVSFRGDGHIITNAHVVEGATSIVAVLSTGEEMAAELVGADPYTDIAVIRMQSVPGQAFATAALGSATGLRAGQSAIAIGSPLGLVGGPSVTVGVVSALGRRITATGGVILHDMIQTDAPIAPGSSGGALCDRSGAVIGITTAIAVSEAGVEGLGFATPIDIARKVAEDILDTGKAVHVWLGIQGSDAERSMLQDSPYMGGALVRDTVAESPAGRAGLLPGDIIVSVGDAEVSSMSGLVVALRTRDPGDIVSLGIWRADREVQLEISLEERPPDV